MSMARAIQDLTQIKESVRRNAANHYKTGDNEGALKHDALADLLVEAIKGIDDYRRLRVCECH